MDRGKGDREIQFRALEGLHEMSNRGRIGQDNGQKDRHSVRNMTRDVAITITGGQPKNKDARGKTGLDGHKMDGYRKHSDIIRIVRNGQSKKKTLIHKKGRVDATRYTAK